MNYAPGSAGLLQPIEVFLSDLTVSEILINRPQEIWVEQGGVLNQFEIPVFTPLHLDRLFQLIANENHQRLSRARPLLSGNLFDGSRVQLCLPPTAKHHTLSIRRKVVKGMTLAEYQEKQFYLRAKRIFSPASETGRKGHRKKTETILSETEKNLVDLYHQENWDLFIRTAIHAKKNIVISGGTSSGKTTFLNACLREIPESDRIIILEDTREVEIPHLNQVSLLASKGDQGEAKITMQDLVQCCLRLRPDRIIVGEIRGAEILDFVAACSTGHEGSITSIHANNPHLAFMRMKQMYKLNPVASMTDEEILNELKSVIDIVIQVSKTPEGRKVQSVYYPLGASQ